MQTSPRWRDCVNTAEAPRKFNRRRHPEAVFGLGDALKLDPNDEIREEVAKPLKKRQPCVPIALEALGGAASIDPDYFGFRKVRAPPE